MELAMLVICVDHVVALGRFMIALNLFRADRDRSKGHFIDLENFGAAEQGHCAGRFHDDDLVCVNRGSRRAMQPQDEDDRKMNAAVAHSRWDVYADAAL